MHFQNILLPLFISTAVLGAPTSLTKHNALPQPEADHGTNTNAATGDMLEGAKSVVKRDCASTCQRSYTKFGPMVVAVCETVCRLGGVWTLSLGR